MGFASHLKTSSAVFGLCSSLATLQYVSLQILEFYFSFWGGRGCGGLGRVLPTILWQNAAPEESKINK